MKDRILISVGGILGLSLLVLALWTWRNSDFIAPRFTSRTPALAASALRCAAVAIAAAGEGLLVLLVLAHVWRRDRMTHVLALSAALVFLLSTAGAVALSLAGR